MIRLMNGRGLRRMTFVIAICALVGALAGIAGSAAAPSNSKSKAKTTAKAKAKAQLKAQRRALKRSFRFGPGPGPMRGPMFGPVHSEAVIPNADGTGFDTVTSDSGTLNSVDDTTVHVKEGTDKKTYKDDVAIDVGNDAEVFRNHEKAKLSDLKPGDHVHVIQAPKGNVVIAEDDAFIAKQQKEFKGFRGEHHHGFGFGPGGPPPAPPGPPSEPKSGSNQNGSDSTESGSSSSNS